MKPIRDISLLGNLNDSIDWSPMIDLALKYRSVTDYNATNLLHDFE